MSKFAHVLFHVLAVIASVGVAASGLIPAPYNAVAAAAISLAQGAVALYNHNHPSTPA